MTAPLDLTAPDGRELLWLMIRMARAADRLIVAGLSGRPGVMDDLITVQADVMAECERRMGR